MNLYSYSASLSEALHGVLKPEIKGKGGEMDNEKFETLKENVQRSYNEGLVTVRALERGKYLDYYIVPTVDSLNYLLKKHYGINEAIIKLCLRKNAVISLPEIRAYLLSESVIPTDEFKELLLESDETKKQEHYKQLAFKALELVGVKPKTTYVCFSDIFNKESVQVKQKDGK